MKKSKPPQINNLFEKIRECIETDRYKQTLHALQREAERLIDLSDALYVLKTGRHEKSKSKYDEIFQAWKYAIRGRTLDDEDIRVVIAFDNEGMLIITVIRMA